MKRLLFAFVLVTLSFNSSFANTLFVTQAGSGNKSGSSWSNASDDIQAMINQASSGDEIWVAAGTYMPNRNADNVNTIAVDDRYNSFVLKAGVKLYGGFAGTETNRDDRDWNINVTVLSGDIGTPGTKADNCYHVVISVNNVGTACLDGFTIKDGYADNYQVMVVGGEVIALSEGAGINCSKSSPAIVNCIISSNFAVENGGGIFTDRSSSIIKNCIIRDNECDLSSGGGGLYNVSSSLTISECVFTGNASMNSGGAIYDDRSSNIISNSLFSNNAAMAHGGAICSYQSTPLITHNRITKNVSGNGGGGFINDGDLAGDIYRAVINNCLIDSNQSNFGGGMGSYWAPIVITNSTLVNNKALSFGKDFYAAHSPDTIYNSIFRGDIYSDGGTKDIQYSMVLNDTAGTANINGARFADTVLFNDPVNGDYSLKARCPGMNQGNNAYYEKADGDITNNSLALDKDMAGNPRVFDDIIDMGAYERQMKLQTITASDIVKTYADADFNPGFYANSGLPLTYVSSDTSVATIAGSNIHIAAVGVSTITISQTGDTIYDPIDVSVKLTVTPAPLHITANRQVKKAGDADPVLTYKVNEADYRTGEDSTIITGSLARDLGETVGAYAITQGTLSAGTNYSIIFTGDSLYISTTASVVKPKLVSGIKAYPNPVSANGQLYFTVDNIPAENGIVQLMDLTGKVVYKTTLTGTEMQLAMPQTAGVYIVNITAANGQRASMRVVVE